MQIAPPIVLNGRLMLYKRVDVLLHTKKISVCLVKFEKTGWTAEFPMTIEAACLGQDSGP